ncbi:MAG: hypothetical protein WCW52_06520 [Elusimicrobiales bacterium]|jgi:hypothetical protein
MNPPKNFWIRRDRERYFLSGLLATCFIGGFVSTYWQFADRVAAKPNITLHQRKISKKQEFQKLKEGQLYVPRFQVGATQYYKLEEKNSLPVIPDLPEVDHGN